MKATSRKGPFSTCPQCRGVFIDRAAMKRGSPLRQIVTSVVMSVVASVVVSRVMRRRHRTASA